MNNCGPCDAASRLLNATVPAVNAFAVKAGIPFTRELLEKVWDYHNEWTSEFFAELDRRGDPGRFDRAKAPIIMELLKRQLLSPRYIQQTHEPGVGLAAKINARRDAGTCRAELSSPHASRISAICSWCGIGRDFTKFITRRRLCSASAVSRMKC